MFHQRARAASPAGWLPSTNGSFLATACACHGPAGQPLLSPPGKAISAYGGGRAPRALVATVVAALAAATLLLVWAQSIGADGHGAAAAAASRAGAAGPWARAGALWDSRPWHERQQPQRPLTLLVANNPRIKQLGRQRLAALLAAASDVVLFNHAALFEELEAAAELLEAQQQPRSGGGRRGCEGAPSRSISSASSSSSGSVGASSSSSSGATTTITTSSSSRSSSSSSSGGGSASGIASPPSFRYSLFLPINHFMDVFALNESLKIRPKEAYARIVCGASPLVLWMPKQPWPGESPLELPLNPASARGMWRDVAILLQSCALPPAVMRLPDGYKAWLPEYEPRPGQAAKWPSSGLFAAAWALRRAQRPHRVALLGFRVSEYNGTGSDFGHNAESEERLYHAWAEQGLLTRINE